MIKKILGIIFILSLSFNAAFIIHLVSYSSKTEASHTKLKLSEHQKKMIEPIRIKMHRANEAIKKQITQCQEKLLTALKTDPADKDAINGCLKNISNLQKKVQQNTIEEIIQIRKFMNPEQCNCLLDSLSAVMNHTSKSCNYPYCQSHKK
jgi:Spy/CpxP family protein refolding chaperone